MAAGGFHWLDCQLASIASLRVPAELVPHAVSPQSSCRAFEVIVADEEVHHAAKAGMRTDGEQACWLALPVRISRRIRLHQAPSCALLRVDDEDNDGWEEGIEAGLWFAAPLN
jgi:hypothetical protein